VYTSLKVLKKIPDLAVLLDKGLLVAKSPIQSLSPVVTTSSFSTTGLAPPSTGGSSNSITSQGKLRYEAYTPPPTSFSPRLGRRHSSGDSSIRASSRTSRAYSEDQEELARTVTPGELTLAAATGMNAPLPKSPPKKKVHTPSVVEKKHTPNLISLDSPFLSEPLVEPASSPPLDHSVASIQGTVATTSSAYVSANASLRTSPEPDAGAESDVLVDRNPWIGIGKRFEDLWDSDERLSSKGRGWSENAMDGLLRRLQSLGMRTEVLPVDVCAFFVLFEIELGFRFH
jgi:hypothetical protein